MEKPGETAESKEEICEEVVIYEAMVEAGEIIEFKLMILEEMQNLYRKDPFSLNDDDVIKSLRIKCVHSPAPVILGISAFKRIGVREAFFDMFFENSRVGFEVAEAMAGAREIRDFKLIMLEKMWRIYEKDPSALEDDATVRRVQSKCVHRSLPETPDVSTLDVIKSRKVLFDVFFEELKARLMG